MWSYMKSCIHYVTLPCCHVQRNRVYIYNIETHMQETDRIIEFIILRIVSAQVREGQRENVKATEWVSNNLCRICFVCRINIETRLTMLFIVVDCLHIVHIDVYIRVYGSKALKMGKKTKHKTDTQKWNVMEYWYYVIRMHMCVLVFVCIFQIALRCAIVLIQVN